MNFWSLFVIWCITAIVFGIGLWAATRIAGLELSSGALALIVIVSTLVSPIPYIGQLLCLGIAALMLYRMTDAELGQAWLLAILARAFAIILVLAAYSYVERHRKPDSVERQIEMLKHAPQSNP